ncbi:MAG: M24 family metallopeptidase, partial [bacterium]
MKRRINKFRDLLKKNDLDAFIIDSRENLFYLTGFTGTSARVVFTPAENYFITDFRYTEQAEEQTDSYKIVEINKKQHKKICDYLMEENIEKVGFESEIVSYNLYSQYKNNLEGVELVPCKDLVQKLRIIKEENEINKIKEAVKIADKAFTHILDFIKPGLTEREISLELEYFMKKEGGAKNSFDFIVASGKRSSMPHGVASAKIVKKGEFITMDFGTVYQGYCSDITRTVVLGKAAPRQIEIYNLVLKAQKEVIKKLKPGMTGKEVDA